MEADRCPSQDTLVAWAREELRASEAWNLQRHIAGCKECQTRLNRMGLQDVLGRLAGSETVEAKRSELMAFRGGDAMDFEVVGDDSRDITADQRAYRIDTGFLADSDCPESLGRIADYEVRGVLGGGGLGIVLDCWQPSQDRAVAIKVLKPVLSADPATAARFVESAEIMASLDHPHCCPILEIGEHEGLPYFVSSLVAGPSLLRRLQVGGLDVSEMVSIASQVASALDRAHSLDITHRNLKPANIFMEPSGNVLVSDFGMTLSKGDEERLSEAGELIAPPLYHSPEQAAGELDFIGPQTDIYSLAVVLYEVLTGCTPFSGSSLTVLYKVTHDEPPPPSARRHDLDAGIDQIMMRALARAPAERFSSALHFAGALEEWLNGSWTVSVPQERIETQDFQVAKELPAPMLGDYVLLGKIGAGGMGRVFKARHSRMERLVAVKILAPGALQDPDRIRRFHREMKAAASLFHRNIVTAFDAREQGGIHYLVMEYVEGLSLNRIVEQHGPLSVDRAVDYTLQTARGLDYAHSRGVIHRDIKPSNLMVDTEGVVKILDMGTARLDDSPAAADLTQDGEVMGTVNYMSPEQAADPRNVDARADIYSLGCTLYYLLTGRPVYSGDIVQTLLAHIQEPIPCLRDHRPDVPEYLEAIFRRMVAKDLEQRYPSVKELIEDLENHRAPEVETPIRETPPPEAPVSSTLAAAAIADQARLAGTQRETPAIGIDLGTAFATIACVYPDGSARTLTNTEGAARTPCAVSINGMNVATGQRAAELIIEQPEYSADGLRMQVGTRWATQQLGGERYPVEALLGLLLANVADDGRRHVGMFKQAVLTVPAGFHEPQRRCIQDIGYVAGLDVLDIIDDTVAAAIGYGASHEWKRKEGRTNEPHHVLVVDIGAGKTDASVIAVEANRFAVLGAAGDLRLGGRDFDRCLANWVVQLFVDGFNFDPRRQPGTMAKLLRTCEETKIALSTQETASRTLKLGEHAAKLKVNRAKLAELTSELMDRVQNTIRSALKQSGLKWEQIAEVLLVGGASRMPQIQGMVRQLGEPSLPVSVAAVDAVAHGAAYYAEVLLGRRSGPTALDIATRSAHSLGVIGMDRQTRQRKTVVLVPRNTPLPTTAKRTFKSRAAGQAPLVIHIVEGESAEPEQCTPVGKCVIDELPADLPPGTPVSVDFQVSKNGRLTVFVESIDGSRAKRKIKRTYGLQRVDLYRWREWAGTMALCSNFF